MDQGVDSHRGKALIQSFSRINTRSLPQMA